MKKKFESCGHSFDAEFFPAESSCMIRFYDSKNEDFGGSLNDLVIAEPSYGFLLVQYIGDDAVMSGVLNEKYFSKNMTEDILCFLEDSLPQCRNVYFPYHIDFAAVTGYDEYNGEYSA